MIKLEYYVGDDLLFTHLAGHIPAVGTTVDVPERQYVVEEVMFMYTNPHVTLSKEHIYMSVEYRIYLK